MSERDPNKKDSTEEGLGDEAEKRQSLLGDEAPGEDEARARDEAEARGIADPDAEEDLGPVPELFKTAGVEAAAEVSDEDAVLDEARKRGVEAEGVEAAQILGISVAFIVVLVVIILLLVHWIGFERQSAERAAAEHAAYPVQREQQLRAQERLQNYGVVDAEAGIYRIPIDRAMQLMVDEAWQEGRQAPAMPVQPEDPAVEADPQNVETEN